MTPSATGDYSCAGYDDFAGDHDQLGYCTDYADCGGAGGYHRAERDLGPADYDTCQACAPCAATLCWPRR